MRLVEKSVSRLVNEFVAAAGSPIMINEQQTFSLLAWLSWDVKT